MTLMTKPTTDAPLGEAVDWLIEHIDEGVKCPCCDQYAKIYKRKISSGQARLLIAQYRAAGTRFAHTADWDHISREGAKLAYWGLMEADGRLREDGGHAGMWRITPKGVEYVLNQLKVPKYAHVFDNDVLRYSGPNVGIRHALGMKFRYDELMAGI